MLGCAALERSLQLALGWGEPDEEAGEEQSDSMEAVHSAKQELTH